MSNPQITGTITAKLELQTGEGQKGTWRKQTYILNTGGNHPKDIAFDVWGDKIESFAIRNGDQVTVTIDIASREYNGKWYTNIGAWRCDGGSGTAQPAQPAQQQQAAPVQQQQVQDDDDFGSDVPF